MINLQIGQKPTDWVAIIEAAASFAWPVAAVIVVILLRKEVRVLLPRLRSVKGWGIDAQLDQIDTAVARIPPVDDAEPPPNPPATAAENELPPDASFSIIQEGVTSPIETVISSWVRFTRETVRYAQILSDRLGYSRPKSSVQALIFLRQRGIISSDMAEAIDSLRQLRNEVVHAGLTDLELTQAQRFQASVDSLIEVIRSRTFAVSSPVRPTIGESPQ